jgi:Fe-S-cluster containining protein
MEKEILNIIKNDNNIKNNMVDNKCSRCGSCCGLFIPVTKKEIKIIREYVKEKNIRPESRINGNTIELRCPFLNLKEHKCNIYEVRPFVCRDFKCNRKDWKKYRNLYMKRSGKYNQYTMDELIYDDITLQVMFIVELLKIKLGDKITYEDLKLGFKLFNREDLLERIEVKECQEEEMYLKHK